MVRTFVEIVTGMRSAFSAHPLTATPAHADRVIMEMAPAADPLGIIVVSKTEN